MIRATLLLAVMCTVAPLGALAASLSLPAGATLRAEQVVPAGSYAMPVGPWTDATGIDTIDARGSITRQAWRIGGTAMTSYELLLDLRGQLVDEGYQIRFECSTAGCGGFDFRFGTEVIGEPEMHVDLGDFHFLAASKPGDVPDHVSLMVSRSPSAGFVQVVQVGARATTDVEVMTTTKAEPGSALPSAVLTEIGPAMEEIGRYVLADLVFGTGSAELGPGSFTSLEELSDYLRQNPSKRVALVGHTDSEGSLAGNISLSKRRAESVMTRLIEDFGVEPAQLEAEGIGYLAPIASNQTDEGRTRNRRVEAILVSTE